jgi:hypothetical protein
LFNRIREGIIQSHFDERLWGLFKELLRLIEVLFDGVDEMEMPDFMYINNKCENLVIFIIS